MQQQDRLLTLADHKHIANLQLVLVRVVQSMH